MERMRQSTENFNLILILFGTISAFITLFYCVWLTNVDKSFQEPEEVPTEPEEGPTEPEDEPTKRVTVPIKPKTKPKKPVKVPTKPVRVPTKPVRVPTKPVIVPTKPVRVPTKPVVVPTKPVMVPTKPVVVPTKPVTVPTKPVMVPTKSTVPKRNTSFTIDYEHNVFLKDGEPFYFISGEFHYFRAPHQRWRDILRKHRAAGLNCVSTYVEWSSHEKVQGTYEFSGDNDIEYFIKLASEEDLLVILRPGPYICAERDFGGFPPWLLTLYPKIKIRRMDQDYVNAVGKWFNELFSRLKKHLYGNDGPIIMVQVENEYGSFSVSDLDYKLWLRNEMKKHIGDAAVLFTTDNPNGMEYGTIPEVYATIDFGTDVDVEEHFAIMRKYSPRGPLVNMEFYPGWLDHWGEPFERKQTIKVIETTEKLLQMKANFNFYMFFGGTNFHFKNGANYVPENIKYQPDITSYDYDAPLDEAGDPTPKYYAIRNLLSERGYTKIPDTLKPPGVAPKGNFGPVELKPALSLFHSKSYMNDTITNTSKLPITFEEMGLQYGYALYETKLPEKIPTSAELSLKGLGDRCNVYLDYSLLGTLSRMTLIYKTHNMTAKPGQTLRLLVENQGRINYGMMTDPKGLLSTPLLGDIPLTGWTMTGFPFEDISWTSKLSASQFHIDVPAFYVGEIVLPLQEKPLDTYIDPSGWTKGLIFVNDCRLGRYWPTVGPQVTLFVPASCLRLNPKKNRIIIFETDKASPILQIFLTSKPYLDKEPNLSFL